jgi:hypothetical protein
MKKKLPFSLSFQKQVLPVIVKKKSILPGSGKKLSRIPDPGGKKAPDPGSGSPHWFVCIIRGVGVIARG